MKTKFEDRVVAALAATPGVERGARLAVALSGGADSVALLAALAAADGSDFAPVCAVHCNFNLRGDESDADERYCRELCERLGVELLVFQVPTASSRQRGESVEMACRRLRYDLFESIRSEGRFDYLAIAHHREDNAETALLNFLRGSGPRGVAAMNARRDFYLRPMLDFTRAEIEQYLQERGLEFRVDSSNLANDYRRNALRNVVLPTIRRYFPDADAGIAATISAMQSSTRMIDDYLRLVAEKYAPEGALNVRRLVTEVGDPRGTLYLLLPRLFGSAVGSPTVVEIVKAAGAGDNESRLFEAADGVRLELHRGELVRYAEPNDATADYLLDVDARLFEPTDPGCTAPVEARFIELTGDEDLRSIVEGKRSAIFDAEKLPRRLQFRHRRDADRIEPFGMTGVKKLSDVFSDLHLSASEKNRAWLLVDGDSVLWALGMKNSRRYKVTSATRVILKLTMKP